MGKAKAPEPPDPKQTSAASTSTNVGTAIANSFLGNVNQITPDGNLTYSQSGAYPWFDPYTGQTYIVPSFTAKQTLSPSQAAIKKQSDAAELNLAELANQQSKFLQGYMSEPVRLDNEAIEARLFELGRKRLDPVFAELSSALDQRLADQGIVIGSKAYDTAQRQFNEGRNDAYNQLALTGREQAINELLTERNQPINEITALLSGSQVSQPSYVNPNMPTIPTTDVAGLINENYNQRLNIWQQQQAQKQSILGGLFSLGAGFLKSDRSAKADIQRVGTLDNGLAVYRYRYKEGGPMMLGLMADEVEKFRPDAVVSHGGVSFVDYERATEAG